MYYKPHRTIAVPLRFSFQVDLTKDHAKAFFNNFRYSGSWVQTVLSNGSQVTFFHIKDPIYQVHETNWRITFQWQIEFSLSLACLMFEALVLVNLTQCIMYLTTSSTSPVDLLFSFLVDLTKKKHAETEHLLVVITNIFAYKSNPNMNTEYTINTCF